MPFARLLAHWFVSHLLVRMAARRAESPQNAFCRSTDSYVWASPLGLKKGARTFAWTSLVVTPPIRSWAVDARVSREFLFDPQWPSWKPSHGAGGRPPYPPTPSCGRTTPREGRFLKGQTQSIGHRRGDGEFELGWGRHSGSRSAKAFWPQSGFCNLVGSARRNAETSPSEPCFGPRTQYTPRESAGDRYDTNGCLLGPEHRRPRERGSLAMGNPVVEQSQRVAQRLSQLEPEQHVRSRVRRCVSSPQRVVLAHRPLWHPPCLRRAFLPSSVLLGEGECRRASRRVGKLRSVGLFRSRFRQRLFRASWAPRCHIPIKRMGGQRHYHFPPCRGSLGMEIRGMEGCRERQLQRDR